MLARKYRSPYWWNMRLVSALAFHDSVEFGRTKRCVLPLSIARMVCPSPATFMVHSPAGIVLPFTTNSNGTSALITILLCALSNPGRAMIVRTRSVAAYFFICHLLVEFGSFRGKFLFAPTSARDLELEARKCPWRRYEFVSSFMKRQLLETAHDEV